MNRKFAVKSAKKEKKCYFCGDTQKCPECGGDGLIYVSSQLNEDYVQCPRCGGNGRCPHC